MKTAITLLLLAASLPSLRAQISFGPTCSGDLGGNYPNCTINAAAVSNGKLASSYAYAASNAGYVLLAKLSSANLNTAADQPIPILATATKYVVTDIIVTNASLNVTTAVGGFYTAAAKGGTAIVSAAQVYTALTASTKYLPVALGAILGTDVRTEATLYFSLTVAQGAAATADIYIFGKVLP